jgi:hypothetical protein
MFASTLDLSVGAVRKLDGKDGAATPKARPLLSQFIQLSASYSALLNRPASAQLLASCFRTKTTAEVANCTGRRGKAKRGSMPIADRVYPSPPRGLSWSGPVSPSRLGITNNNSHAMNELIRQVP